MTRWVEGACKSASHSLPKLASPHIEKMDYYRGEHTASLCEC